MKTMEHLTLVRNSYYIFLRTIFKDNLTLQQSVDVSEKLDLEKFLSQSAQMISKMNVEAYMINIFSKFNISVDKLDKQITLDFASYLIYFDNTYKEIMKIAID
jgi:hypothetical protein